MHHEAKIRAVRDGAARIFYALNNTQAVGAPYWFAPGVPGWQNQ